MQPPHTSPCPSCGHENEHEWLFCASCGTPLRTICPACQHGNQSDAAFCVMCGTPLGESPQATVEPTEPAGPLIPAYEREGDHLAKPPVGNAESPLDSVGSDSSAIFAFPTEAPEPPSRETESTYSTPASQTLQGSRACPRCSHRNEMASMFCVNCGLPFEGDRLSESLAHHDFVGPTGTPYQGFWIRLVAYIIDYFVLVILLVLLLSLIPGLPGASNIFGLYFYAVIMRMAYDTVMIGQFRGTVGMLVVRIEVLCENGSAVSYWRALGRHLAAYVSGLILGIGYLMIAFQEDKRALHDLIAGTVVVKRN